MITPRPSHRPVKPAAVRFLLPSDWPEALAMKHEHPDATPIHGGTDVMVELNFARRRPEALLDLSRVEELSQWNVDGPLVHVGSGVTYDRVIRELADVAPGLAMAARTVGSPQIRNRGTVGGNLGTASPAGDAHPPLLAAGATVEVASVRGERTIPIDDFFTGPKRNALAPDELIRAVTLTSADGPQQFSKIGPRNAMVIATVSFSLALHAERGTAGTGIGSAGPTPLRAPAAEALVAEALAGDRPFDDDLGQHFGELVAAAATPIDDVRGTQEYRRHALAVLARRCLSWTWSELRGSPRWT